MEISMSERAAQHELETSDDVVLVHSAKTGNMAALEELIKRHTTMIFRVAMHITNSREDAEDVVQDAFLKAFQHLHHFEERARFSTWLKKIAVNEALSKVRNSRRWRMVSVDEETEGALPLAASIADWRPNPEQDYGRTELREILQQALASLQHSYRVVFLLRDVEGLSIAETAELLGLCVPNVKARLFRARLKLRKFLSRYFEERNTANETSLPIEHVIRELRAVTADV
jgi:RNA polymerase sigma-70 factor, ECF subfamily